MKHVGMYCLRKQKKYRQLLFSSAAAANAVMLGGGYFNPLSGYMDLADLIGVAERMQNIFRIVLADSGCQHAERRLLMHRN